MPACSPGGNAAAPVDLNYVASAIPPIGLAPDAIARAELRAGTTMLRGTARLWAWQHGRMLIVLDQQSGSDWHLSELSFDNGYGYYHEERRNAYDSPREAAGVALAWALRLGSGPSLAAAASLDAWSSLTFSDVS